MSEADRTSPRESRGALIDRLEEALRSRVRDIRPLSGGCVGDVRSATLDDGRVVVVKAAMDEAGEDALAREGFMLRWLRARTTLPTPDVLAEAPGLLVMERVEHDGVMTRGAERHAADLLADLHDITPDAAEHGEAPGRRFGFERGTAIGGLVQPNAWSASWVAFFREQRLLHMGRSAARAGRLAPSVLARLERLCARLGDFLVEPASPSLVHGDVWAGNVLVRQGRVAALIDPAVHFAHAEVELAFIALFSTFGGEFFERYAERRPIDPGFFTPQRGARLARKDVLNLYPLLVHARLFGGEYGHDVDATLSRAGF